MSEEQSDSNQQFLAFPRLISQQHMQTVGKNTLEMELTFFRNMCEALHQGQAALDTHVTMFRDELWLFPDQCERAIQTLQTIRRQAHSLLDTLNAGTHPAITYPGVFFDHVETLDGKPMGRLILDVDAFRTCCNVIGRDADRINRHVALQSELQDMLDTLGFTLQFLHRLIEHAEGRPSSQTH